jgi:hypothetical protein
LTVSWERTHVKTYSNHDVKPTPKGDPIGRRKASGNQRADEQKPLLFLRVAEAVKSGTLHVEDSYRYRSLDDYLIPRDEWEPCPNSTDGIKEGTI